ncbi:MAG: hypothetical protein U9Q06_00485, partial [Nanoarchaeota archaeon]|nr:hypothetical protein [Nanoarchaeota archaeon]
KEIKEKVESNGIEFVEDGNGYWNFEIQGHNFKTVYNGLETENIEADFEFSLNQLNNLPLYYIGGNREEISELIQNIGEFLIRNPAEVCLEGTGCGEGELVRNCSSNILVFRVSEEEEIKLYKEENCVFINAPEGEEIKSVDKIIFKLLGIQ